VLQHERPDLVIGMQFVSLARCFPDLALEVRVFDRFPKSLPNQSELDRIETNSETIVGPGPGFDFRQHLRVHAGEQVLKVLPNASPDVKCILFQDDAEETVFTGDPHGASTRLES